MKKIWKTRTEEGVSPVIATILMVAITVVLAAVLYVMVINIRPPNDIPPAGSIMFDVQSQTEVEIGFGTFSPTPAPMEIKVIITNISDRTDVVELTFSGAPDATTVEMGATGGATATYTDLNYNSQELNSGDFIVVDGLHSHTTYEVILFHYDTNSVCSLIGDTSFNLP
jgi:flagellin-like protein